MKKVIESSRQWIESTEQKLADNAAVFNAEINKHEAAKKSKDAIIQKLEREVSDLKAQLEQVDAVSRGLGALRSQLLATTRELERLEAGVTRVRVDGGASGLVAEVRRQEAETRRALDAWQKTADELR